MCDYSLESVKSRPAKVGEELVVKQFQSGSKGFIASSALDCAVCCKDGVEMTLALKGAYQTAVITQKGLLDQKNEEFDGEIPVTFHTLPKFHTAPWGGLIYGYRDGFILPNGRYLSVQRLAIGTCATVTKALPPELIEAAKGKKAFKEEIEVKAIEAASPALVD